MKKTILILTGVLCCHLALQAQEAEKKTVSQYYRNALTSMMVYHPEDEVGYDVYQIFKDLPPEDKYDMHDVDLRVLDNSKITGVAKHKGNGLHRQTYGSSIRGKTGER